MSRNEREIVREHTSMISNVFFRAQCRVCEVFLLSWWVGPASTTRGCGRCGCRFIPVLEVWNERAVEICISSVSRPGLRSVHFSINFLLISGRPERIWVLFMQSLVQSLLVQKLSFVWKGVVIVHDFPQSFDTYWNCHVLSRHIFLAQVAPKLDDREIFVTHLPQKAGTEDSRTRSDLFNVFSVTFASSTLHR